MTDVQQPVPNADPNAAAGVQTVPPTTDTSGQPVPMAQSPVFNPAIDAALQGASPASISPSTNDPAPNAGQVAADLGFLVARFERLLTELQMTDRGV